MAFGGPMTSDSESTELKPPDLSDREQAQIYGEEYFRQRVRLQLEGKHRWPWLTSVLKIVNSGFFLW